MSLKILIPTPLRKLTGDVQTVEVEPGTIGDIIQTLDQRFPGLRSKLCEEDGGLRRFINVYVDGEDVRFLQNVSTPVKDGAEVSIVPAIAGG
ncbi:MAG TPA: ubiquitin-like small modifier protein 1 [Blastocatellia bacterium]|nr:ubiquitin-like small modifier protein 1 [Blastocatellia bacterium]